jgi:pimeloyl-ACP methyl ester carboxylesterase
MGWSYGGATAIWTAAVDARVRAVVSAGGVGDGERWMRSARTPEEWRALAERAAADRAARMEGAEPQTIPRGEILKLDPESARLSAQARKKSSGASDELALSFVEETLAFNPEWVVGRIAPRAALFITGTEDRVVPAAESRAMHASAGAPKRLVEIEDCAHYDIYGGAPFARAMDEATQWFDTHLAAE